PNFRHARGRRGPDTVRFPFPGETAMTTRRDLLKFGALATAAAALPAFGSSASLGNAIPRADRPLNILILGGTGFTGPFQVAYALARGHKVTTFNRGRRPIAEWGDKVEQLVGDRTTGD